MTKLNYILFLLCLFGCKHPESNDYNRYKDGNTDGILNTESSSETHGYKVVGIKDGDTYVVLIDGKEQVIRLEHIDCPEKKQDFGEVAKQFLSNQIFGKQVEVEEKDIDRYGRTIGIVFTDKHINVNGALLKAGLTWHYVYFDKNNPAWDNLEREARAAKKGLWSGPNPIEPWNFRKQKKEQLN